MHALRQAVSGAMLDGWVCALINAGNKFFPVLSGMQHVQVQPE